MTRLPHGSVARPRPSRRHLPRLVVAAVALVAAVGGALTARPAQALTAQEIFINSVAEGAQQGWIDYGVPASVTISQAILETGWGKSDLSSKYNNYFGIKCSKTPSPYQSGCVDMVTTEYDAYGNAYTVTASFRRYASPAMSMRDHGYFLTVNSRYAPAFAYSNEPVKFADAMHVAGYATDPNYAHYLYRLMSQYNLFRFDFGKTLGGPVANTPAAPNPIASVADIVYPQRTSLAPESSASPSVDESPAPSAPAPVSVSPTVAPSSQPSSSISPTAPSSTPVTPTTAPTSVQPVAAQVPAGEGGPEPEPSVSSAEPTPTAQPSPSSSSTAPGLPATGA